VVFFQALGAVNLGQQFPEPLCEPEFTGQSSRFFVTPKQLERLGVVGFG
jgi:hypothetical protein